MTYRKVDKWILFPILFVVVPFLVGDAEEYPWLLPMPLRWTVVVWCLAFYGWSHMGRLKGHWDRFVAPSRRLTGDSASPSIPEELYSMLVVLSVILGLSGLGYFMAKPPHFDLDLGVSQDMQGKIYGGMLVVTSALCAWLTIAFGLAGYNRLQSTDAPELEQSASAPSKNEDDASSAHAHDLDRLTARFADISPKALYPKGFENSKPGLDFGLVHGMYDETGEFRDSRFTYGSYTGQVQGQPIFASFNLLHGIGRQTIESVSIRFRDHKETLHRYIKDRMQAEFPPTELHTLGSYLYWKPPEGIRVILKSDSYDLVLEDGVLPLSFSETTKNVPPQSNIASLLEGEWVVWSLFNKEYREVRPRIEFDTKYDHYMAPAEVDEGIDGYKEIKGRLHFKNGEMGLQEAQLINIVNI